MSWLYAAPPSLIALTVSLCVLCALEAGYKIGQVAPIAEQQSSTISASILTVVGLLLGFSFAMAGNRYEHRIEVAVRETNAIGTFWLRTSLLSEPIKSEMRARIRRFVDVHIEHRAAGTDTAKTAQLDAESARLQQELWALLIQDARAAPEASRLRLLMPALNAMIDDAAAAQAAGKNRLPGALVIYLSTLIMVAGVVVGYRPRAEKRNLVLWVLFLVTLGGALLMLLDMDRPRRGLINTSPTPYIELRENLRSEPP